MFSQKNALPLHKLNAAETKDPVLVFDELFDFADLPDVRAMLWCWLKATVTGTYHKELSATERSAILSLYEKLEKTVEAAHVLYVKEKHAPLRKISKAGKTAKTRRRKRQVAG
jgi:hypothetical protein